MKKQLITLFATASLSLCSSFALAQPPINTVVVTVVNNHQAADKNLKITSVGTSVSPSKAPPLVLYAPNGATLLKKDVVLKYTQAANAPYRYYGNEKPVPASPEMLSAKLGPLDIAPIYKIIVDIQGIDLQGKKLKNAACKLTVVSSLNGGTAKVTPSNAFCNKLQAESSSSASSNTFNVSATFQ